MHLKACSASTKAKVYAWIVRIVRNPAAAEDLTIETFWRIYQHRRHFDPSRPFGACARSVATRLAIDHLRSWEHLIADSREAAIAATASEEMKRDELQAEIDNAFLSLPPRLKAAATLALIEELPYSEFR